MINNNTHTQTLRQPVRHSDISAETLAHQHSMLRYICILQAAGSSQR